MFVPCSFPRWGPEASSTRPKAISSSRFRGGGGAGEAGPNRLRDQRDDEIVGTKVPHGPNRRADAEGLPCRAWDAGLDHLDPVSRSRIRIGWPLRLRAVRRRAFRKRPPSGPHPCRRDHHACARPDAVQVGRMATSGSAAATAA